MNSAKILELFLKILTILEQSIKFLTHTSHEVLVDTSKILFKATPPEFSEYSRSVKSIDQIFQSRNPDLLQSSHHLTFSAFP